MSSLAKTNFQEMSFLDEMIDQVIILDKSKNVCCANKSALTRFGNDINGKNIPIIMLTAKGEEEDKIKGLNSGADDYITKPFSFPELLARVKALLRRSKPSVVADIVEFEDLKIDRMTRRVYRKKKEIHLGPKEYDLLNFFIKNPKRVYSREQILENVWSENINVENRTIDVHIRRLRQNINIIGVKELIRTVRSAGYSLN